MNSLYENKDNLNKRILDYHYEIMKLRIELATFKENRYEIYRRRIEKDGQEVLLQCNLQLGK